jgi:sortase A
MKDRRNVDDLSVEELERVLLIKRREARLARVRQMDSADQVVGRDPLEPPPPPSVPPPLSTVHRQFQGIGASANYHSVEVGEGRWQSKGVRIIRWLEAPLHINWRFIFNSIMLLIEATAVIGLIFVIINTRQSQEKITDDVMEIVVPPTPTAVPQVRAVVLPSGHTPPDARGFSQPESLPEQLREIALKITPQPIPTPGPEHATRIVIPSIGVDHPVVLGDDWESLKRGVGHTPWSANPGQAGNCVLSAYNDIYGGIFKRLSDMELGDEIFIYTSIQVYRYETKATHIVEPTQVEVMDPTDASVLTLVSSYPDFEDDKRIIVIADLVSPQGDSG